MLYYVIRHGDLFYTEAGIFISRLYEGLAVPSCSRLVYNEEGQAILNNWKSNNTIIQGLAMKNCYLEVLPK